MFVKGFFLGASLGRVKIQSETLAEVGGAVKLSQEVRAVPGPHRGGIFQPIRNMKDTRLSL
jgi:hypothetical protein